MKRDSIIRAELKVDIYDGPNCDQHRKFWCEDGDKESANFSEDIILNLDLFPAGTLVTISIPICPKCGVNIEVCDCGFDWKNWIEEQYV